MAGSADIMGIESKQRYRLQEWHRQSGVGPSDRQTSGFRSRNRMIRDRQPLQFVELKDKSAVSMSTQVLESRKPITPDLTTYNRCAPRPVIRLVLSSEEELDENPGDGPLSLKAIRQRLSRIISISIFPLPFKGDTLETKLSP